MQDFSSQVDEKLGTDMDGIKKGTASDSIDYPRSLQIMIGTFCHINCIMCPQDHRLKVALNNDILKKNI